jgi:transposase-like protein
MGRPAKYPPEFQREAIELVLGSGRSINEVALSLGSSAARWATGSRRLATLATGTQIQPA